MSKLVRLLLLVVTVSFFVTHAAAKGKPGGGGGKGGGTVKTELCIMTDDVSSLGAEVEVGTIAWQYSPEPIMLHLTDELLDVGEADLVGGQGEWIEQLTEGDYYGYARVLKKDGRLDFAFTDGGFDAASGCRPISKDDDFPVDPDAGICPYELILQYGVYDRKADTDYFTPPAVEKIISYYEGHGNGGAYSKHFSVEQVTIVFPPHDE